MQKEGTVEKGRSTACREVNLVLDLNQKVFLSFYSIVFYMYIYIYIYMYIYMYIYVYIYIYIYILYCAQVGRMLCLWSQVTCLCPYPSTDHAYHENV